jgi:hypothetical protein
MKMMKYALEVKKVNIIDTILPNTLHANSATKNTVKHYNQVRLLLSLEFKPPNSVFQNTAYNLFNRGSRILDPGRKI